MHLNNGIIDIYQTPTGQPVGELVLFCSEVSFSIVANDFPWSEYFHWHYNILANIQ